MDFVKKIPPSWIVVAVLIVIVFVLMFRQSRSGYTPTAGAPITLMDLQEYLVFSPAQKQNYVNKLMAYQPRLASAVSANSFTTYKMLLDEVMTNSMVPGTPATGTPATGTPPLMNSRCSAGQYSTTGNQPGCMPCPMDTYCPTEGMTTPIRCSQPFVDQYVKTVCTRTSNTQVGQKTVCTAPKRVSGYIPGSPNILGNPGTCI